jgi:hypothetical protein
MSCAYASHHILSFLRLVGIACTHTRTGTDNFASCCVPHTAVSGGPRRMHCACAACRVAAGTSGSDSGFTQWCGLFACCVSITWDEAHGSVHGMPEKARRKRPSTDRHTHERGFSCKRHKVWLKRKRVQANLLLLPERSKTDTGDLDDLEADTGDITLGLAATTEAGDEDLVVLVDEVKTTVVL